MPDRFSSHSGGIHHSAYIGGTPQHRDWRPGDVAYPPVIHPTARIEAFVSVDAGTREPTSIGARTWLMKSIHVGHDSILGADIEIAPMTTICGHCIIEDGVKIGANSVLRPGIRVGKGAYIGCGSVVVKDVPPGEVWAGNPAHCIQHHGHPDQFDLEHLVGA